MKALSLQSEKFRATGNLAAEGMLNQLGRPGLGLLDVLIRETVQNSWDARANDHEPVMFGISFRHLIPSQIKFLSDSILAKRPRDLKLQEYFKNDPCVLEISDRGTKGLGGPTRADVVTNPEDSRDFVDFLRNIGQPPQNPSGGGTYGYGKAVLYLASEINTICIFTRCFYENKLESRFIVSAVGNQFVGGKQKLHHYTGRHWWGNRKRRIVEPVKGASANRIASKLGIAPFEDDETGTTILVLGPVLEDRKPYEAMQHMGSALLWYFWPKMLEFDNQQSPMIFDLKIEGEKFSLPKPAEVSPINGFVDAMKNIKAKRLNIALPEDSNVSDIASQRPDKFLGHLSLQKFVLNNSPGPNDQIIKSARPIDESCHYVALMRNAELVVKYLEGPALPSGAIGYAGVFIPDVHHDVDSAFAKAEPPTHDDWIPEILQERREKTYVNVALKRIKAALKDFVAPFITNFPPVANVPLGLFATRLAGLIPGEDGDAPTVKTQHNTETVTGNLAGRKAREKPTLTVTNDGELTLLHGKRVLKINFRIQGATRSSGVRVSVRPGVLLEGNSLESTAPEGKDTPRVLGWKSKNGLERDGNTLDIFSNSIEDWSVFVSVPEDTVVGANLDYEYL